MRNHNLPPSRSSSYYITDATILDGEPLFYINIKSDYNLPLYPRTLFLADITLSRVELRNNYSDEYTWFELSKQDIFPFYDLISKKH